jgi:hypothetical protein
MLPACVLQLYVRAFAGLHHYMCVCVCVCVASWTFSMPGLLRMVFVGSSLMSTTMCCAHVRDAVWQGARLSII